MRYQEFGPKQKPVLVLIHGFGVSWKMWEPIIPRFSKAYQVCVPLLPGHDLEQASVFQSVEDCAAEITGHLSESGNNQVHAIIGCSLGGSIAVAIPALIMESWLWLNLKGLCKAPWPFFKPLVSYG